MLTTSGVKFALRCSLTADGRARAAHTVFSFVAEHVNLMPESLTCRPFGSFATNTCRRLSYDIVREPPFFSLTESSQ